MFSDASDRFLCKSFVNSVAKFYHSSIKTLQPIDVLSDMDSYHMQVIMSGNSTSFSTVFKLSNDLFCLNYWGFTPLSILFQLYHGNSSPMHAP